MDLDVFFYVTAGMGVALLFGIAGRLGTRDDSWGHLVLR